MVVERSPYLEVWGRAVMGLCKVTLGMGCYMLWGSPDYVTKEYGFRWLFGFSMLWVPLCRPRVIGFCWRIHKLDQKCFGATWMRSVFGLGCSLWKTMMTNDQCWLISTDSRSLTRMHSYVLVNQWFMVRSESIPNLQKSSESCACSCARPQLTAGGWSRVPVAVHVGLPCRTEVGSVLAPVQWVAWVHPTGPGMTVFSTNSLCTPWSVI